MDDNQASSRLGKAKQNLLEMNHELEKVRGERALKYIQKFAPVAIDPEEMVRPMNRPLAVKWIKENIHYLWSSRTEELCEVIAIMEESARSHK